MQVTFDKSMTLNGELRTVARVAPGKEFPEGGTFVFKANAYNGKQSINGGLSAGYESTVKVGRIPLWKIRIEVEFDADGHMRFPRVYASREDKRNAPYSRGYDDPTQKQMDVLYELARTVGEQMDDDEASWSEARKRDHERLVAEAERSVRDAEQALAQAKAKLAELDA